MRNYNLTEDVFVNPGNMGCPGCGATIAMNLALKALGEKTIVTIPACCWAVIAGPYPMTTLKVPILHTVFASAAVTASGIRAALEYQGDNETTVMAWAGDGGTFDIGIQSLSGAAERNDDIIFVCYDNEAYMNTGVQKSSSTPYGTNTTTSPGTGWKKTRKKKIMEIMAAHRIPYAATANIAYPQDLINKFEKAKSIKGTKFIHIYASCPTGWKIPSEISVKIARMATKCNFFPLYEVEDGIHYQLNHVGDQSVREYYKMQGRFKHLSDDDIDKIQNYIDSDFEVLLGRL
ncbi:MAG: pyruvate synthase subunit beta [Desulfobacterales bacterium]|nr:pyruvate synthase subunit beta [Desulfobacterales bacterium]MCP4162558.1 pyruvate synthase subunit beta [Deltaproteobacteria bacterium]